MNLFPPTLLKLRKCSYPSLKFKIILSYHLSCTLVHLFYDEQSVNAIGSSIKWNFTKFLVDKQGQPIKRYGTTTKPIPEENIILKKRNLKFTNFFGFESFFLQTNFTVILHSMLKRYCLQNILIIYNLQNNSDFPK